MPKKLLPIQPKFPIKPYSDEELSDPSIDKKIEGLMRFFDQYGIDYDKFTPDHFSFLDKKAYPNDQQYSRISGQRDVQKWMMAVKNLHYRQKAGFSYQRAIREITKGWAKMEVFDFLNWLRFYQEGARMKYKFAQKNSTAQMWYENGQPGYFLHIKKDPPKPQEPVIDEQSIQDARQEASRHQEKKEVIEKQRNKIIGRLDSAEKLLRSPDGQMFAGQEMEGLMEAIYNLKKKVRLVNKLSTSTRLYEDMIVREGNVLARQGFTKAASLLYSVAQTPGASGESAQGADAMLGSLPDAASPPDPSGAGQGGIPAGLPSTAPGVPSINTTVNSDQNNQPPASAIMSPNTLPGTGLSTPSIMPQQAPEEVQSRGIKEFIRNMNDGLMTDNLEVEDPEGDLMVSEAQIAPAPVGGPPAAVLEEVPISDNPPPERGDKPNLPATKIELQEPAPSAAKPAIQEEPLEVSEEELPDGGVLTGVDAKMEAILRNVSIADIIAELEDIAKIYKTRDLPRRLSFVDLMLNGKGISSYFPQLSEAQNKALEANNYISTRIDDILSKLQGSIAARSAPVREEVASPEVQAVKNKLQEDRDKDKRRKALKKEQEAAELENPAGKPKPQVEMGELAPSTPAPKSVG